MAGWRDAYKPIQPAPELSGTMRYPDEGTGFIPVLEVGHAAESPPPPEESFMRGNY